jgi:hypothetical protein
MAPPPPSFHDLSLPVGIHSDVRPVEASRRAVIPRVARPILLDINEEWITGKKYSSMGEDRSSTETGLGKSTAHLRHYYTKNP